MRMKYDCFEIIIGSWHAVVHSFNGGGREEISHVLAGMEEA